MLLKDIILFIFCKIGSNSLRHSGSVEIKTKKIFLN